MRRPTPLAGLTANLAMIVVVILGFGMSLAFVEGDPWLPDLTVAGHALSVGALSVLILLAIKTVAEFVVTTVVVATARPEAYAHG